MHHAPGVFEVALDHAAPTATSSHTVSPKDLFAMTPSAPNSNSLTNLTTPSMYDGSPGEDSFDTSPMFPNDEAGGTWSSLFPEENDMYTPADPTAQDLDSSHEAHLIDHSVKMMRNESSSSLDAQPEDPLRHRLSVSSGVSKNRRTGRSLAPIKVPDNDTKALKRAKNTLAARKSRQKKRDVEDSLRADLAAMTADRDKWKLTAISHGAPIPDSS